MFPPFSVFDTGAPAVRDGVSIKQELSHNCHTKDIYGGSGFFLRNLKVYGMILSLFPGEREISGNEKDNPQAFIRRGQQA